MKSFLPSCNCVVPEIEYTIFDIVDSFPSLSWSSFVVTGNGLPRVVSVGVNLPLWTIFFFPITEPICPNCIWLPATVCNVAKVGVESLVAYGVPIFHLSLCHSNGLPDNPSTDKLKSGILTLWSGYLTSCWSFPSVSVLIPVKYNVPFL